MSHVVQIRTEVRDPVAVRAACRRLHIDEPVVEKVKLFSESASGLAVRLRDWRYPVVVDTASGETKFDNYEGKWGDRVRLDEFLQAYAVEKAKIEARRSGYFVNEQALEDGSIKVTIQVGGAT